MKKSLVVLFLGQCDFLKDTRYKRLDVDYVKNLNMNIQYIWIDINDKVQVNRSIPARGQGHQTLTAS